jgi:hypothetical protein
MKQHSIFPAVTTCVKLYKLLTYQFYTRGQPFQFLSFSNAYYIYEAVAAELMKLRLY